MDGYDLIVVGGGPAGSVAAATAARGGLRVLLLEADQHPRAHVGESLLPGIIPILEEIDALGAVESAGFTIKTGSTHWGWGKTPEWDLWFSDSEEYPHAWLVERATFDQILFDAAARAGAETHQQAVVKSFIRDGERVVGVAYKPRGQEAVTARAPLVLDASGHAMLLARELELRELIPGLQHEASWAHFENAGRLPSPRESQALFIAEPDRWFWCFPLSAMKTSVGVIQLQTGGAARPFDDMVQSSDRLSRVLGPDARRCSPVRSLHDWSYRMNQVCGPGWALVGDASGFVDPALSTGVILAMHSGWHAARLAVAMKRGNKSEEDFRQEYDAHHRQLFGDVLRMVKFFYRQNLHRDEYFWESKRILVEGLEYLSPRKSFMLLTSGLSRNLAFDAKRVATRARRLSAAESAAADADGARALRFVCLHLRWNRDADTKPLYFLIEPIDPAEPTLFTTRNWHVNCLAPHLKNDPFGQPALAPSIKALETVVRRLDTQRGESLAAFWARARDAIADAVADFPEYIELVRVFGE